MLDARVLSFCVLANKNSVDIIIRRLEAFNRHARSNVGEEGEGSAKREVE
jgi:hypothetical protein